MRIIAGSARGRKLLSVSKDLPVRPISSRIKQSLFDILRPRIFGSRFLDLFAGTGAVGMEALSRGASQVFFVDMDDRCVKVIQRNIERAGFKDKAKAHRGNVLSPLSWVNYRAGVEQFDLIFAGPPYVDEQKRPLRFSQPVLDNLAASRLLAPNGWLILQHHKKEPASAPAGYELFRRARYGDTHLDFVRHAGETRSPFSSDPETDPDAAKEE
ncbi:MAG: 16S rRNA (guanine(966)-N(2))-methyltransferase RsmD [Elusimicrobia bacterium]|nr:16S rRNA (guanine(966)-N(2))-methyltransferase RsmD [Elusimicrobiota bacterium]